MQWFEQIIAECRQNHFLNEVLAQFSAAAMSENDIFVIGNRQGTCGHERRFIGSVYVRKTCFVTMNSRGLLPLLHRRRGSGRGGRCSVTPLQSVGSNVVRLENFR